MPSETYEQFEKLWDRLMLESGTASPLWSNRAPYDVPDLLEDGFTLAQMETAIRTAISDQAGDSTYDNFLAYMDDLRPAEYKAKETVEAFEQYLFQNHYGSFEALGEPPVGLLAGLYSEHLNVGHVLWIIPDLQREEVPLDHWWAEFIRRADHEKESNRRADQEGAN